MNKMKEVAQLLGVELEEEFKIKDLFALFKISNGGLAMRYSSLCEWANNDEMLGLLLRGVYEIERNILTEKEKEYLSAVIKPFKNKVEYIAKFKCISGGREFIVIDFGDDMLEFPPFEKNTMYTGMDLNKSYTLRELGLKKK